MTKSIPTSPSARVEILFKYPYRVCGSFHLANFGGFVVPRVQKGVRLFTANQLWFRQGIIDKA